MSQWIGVTCGSDPPDPLRSIATGDILFLSIIIRDGMASCDAPNNTQVFLSVGDRVARAGGANLAVKKWGTCPTMALV